MMALSMIVPNPVSQTSLMEQKSFGRVQVEEGMVVVVLDG
jgi:hypothetical protein